MISASSPSYSLHGNFDDWVWLIYLKPINRFFFLHKPNSKPSFSEIVTVLFPLFNILIKIYLLFWLSRNIPVEVLSEIFLLK